MIGAILGVANGLLPIKPLNLVQGLLDGLNGEPATRSRAADGQALRLSDDARRAGLAPVNGEIDLAAYRTQYEAKLAAFQDQLGKVFSESGLNLTSDVTLRYDSTANRLVVDGDHSQRGQIEALLDQHPRLVPAFRQLESANRFLTAQVQGGEQPSVRQALAAYRGAAEASAYTVRIAAE